MREKDTYKNKQSNRNNNNIENCPGFGIIAFWSISHITLTTDLTD
jgi:hypothetical protein